MKRRLTSRSDKSRKTTASRHARRGLAATELVMILPLLMVVVFGCLDMARATRHYMVLCNAVRTGAEYGATQRFTPYTYSDWQARVRDVVNEELQEISGDPTLSTFIIKIKQQDLDNAIDTELSMVRVEVEVYFTPTFNWPGLPTIINIKHHVHMRQFR